MQNGDQNETQTLKVKKDSIAFVKLKSHAMAGFVWMYAIEDSSIAVVDKRDNEFSDKKKRVGDSGFEVFAIKGLKKGETKIKFEQKRPWKNSGGAVRTKSYLIKVE